ncbi:MAG: TraB/VirB10 family protein [Nitrososphaerales archaeon]
MDKFNKQKAEEEKYILEEEGEAPSEKKNTPNFLSHINIKWIGGFAGTAVILFLLSRLWGGGSNVVVKGDPEAQKKMLEDVLKSQAQMNQKILEELHSLNQKLSSPAPAVEEKEKKESAIKIQEPSPPPPPPPSPPSFSSPSTPVYAEPPKLAEPYKPKINRVERKEEQSPQSKTNVLLTQANTATDVPVFTEGGQADSKKAEEKKEKTVYLPAGTTLKGRIINSFPAPVGGERFPAVLVELDGYARLPNNYRLDLSRCLVIAKGEGTYILERAKLEVYKLSCILKNGKVIEVSPKGMIVSAEDGMEGVAGKFLNINREQILTYLGGTTLGGFFSALQQSQLQKYTTAFGTTTDIKNEFLYSLYGSLAQTWNEFARFYLDQAKKIFPVVVVQAGKPVYIVLVDGVSMEVPVDELRKNI